MPARPDQPRGAVSALQARPSYAARTMVQSELSRIVPLVAKGSSEWTITLRAEAARLLHALLLYAEASALQYLPAVLQSLRVGLGDDDAGVASHTLGAVHVLGMNVPAKHWAPFALEAVAAEQLSMAQRGTGLRVLSELLFAAGASGQPADQAMVQLLAGALGHRELDHPQLHGQLLAAASNLLRWGKQQCSTVAAELLQLLLRMQAAERSRAAASAAIEAAGSGAAVQAAAIVQGGVTAAAAQLTTDEVMGELAAACGLGSAQEVCNQLAPRLLPAICQVRGPRGRGIQVQLGNAVQPCFNNSQHAPCTLHKECQQSSA
jgi:hypothetical protein